MSLRETSSLSVIGSDSVLLLYVHVWSRWRRAWWMWSCIPAPPTKPETEASPSWSTSPTKQQRWPGGSWSQVHSFCVITSAVSLLLSHRCSPPSPPPELTLGQLLTLSSRGRQISHYSSQVYTAVCLSLTEASPDVIGARVFFKPSIQSILECFLFSCLGVSDCLLLVVSWTLFPDMF